MTDEAKLKKIKRLINCFHKAETKDDYWDNDQYASRAMDLINKIYLEVDGKLER